MEKVRRVVRRLRLVLRSELRRVAIALIVLSALCVRGWSEDDKGLVAHWDFNEGKGDVLHDRSGNNHHGKIRGAKWVKCGTGYALEFDGKDDYVDWAGGKKLQFRDKISVSAWIHPKADSPRDAVIVGGNPTLWGMTHCKGRVWFYVSSGSNFCNGLVPLGQWTHVAAAYDGRILRFYVNGGQCHKKELPKRTAIKRKNHLLMGGHWQGRYYNGMIKGVGIYSRVLSEKEIVTLAGARSGAEEEKLTTKPDEQEAATQFFKKHSEAVASQRSGRQIWLANRELGIEFLQEEKGFYVTRLYGVGADEEFLAQPAARSQAVLWQLLLRRDKGRDTAAVAVTSNSGAEVSSKLEREAFGTTLRLRWAGLDIPDEADALDVEVSVRLNEGDPLSRWRINVTNRSKTHGLWEITFPVLTLRPIRGEPQKNFLTIPWNRGILLPDPFSNPALSGELTFGEYPGHPRLMQFQALYHESGAGVYLALHDGEGYRKTFGFRPCPVRQAIEYKATHYPSNMGFPAEDYRMTYDVCLGPFKGDWYGACQIYRKWALKQQWCAKGPLSSRNDIPRWYKEAPVMLVTASRRGERLVDVSRDRMLECLRFFDTELPLIWYGWKKYFPDMTDYQKEGSPWQVPQKRDRPPENIHDGNYPVLPAQPNFSPACKAISEAGGHVLAYVCSSVYDPGLNENAPFAAQAKPNVVLNEDGKVQLAEGGRVAWTMCYHTEWWQKRLSETAAGLLKNEHARGIYFDTFYGGRMPWSACFNTAHGHSHGGGNDGYLAARELALAVREAMKQADPEAVIAGGEGSAETAIELLDAILYVHGNIEPGTVPLFAAVYGDYICRYGRSVRPWREGHYVDCAAMFTEGAQMGRMTLHEEDPKDFPERMEFMRKLAGYWKPEVGGGFLAYGQFLRPIKFKQPDPMPLAAYVPTWAAEGTQPYDVPALHTGVFRIEDGHLGIFIVNVTEKPIPVGFEMTPDRYPIQKSKTFRVARVSATGERAELGDQKGTIAFDGEVAGHGVIFLEAKP